MSLQVRLAIYYSYYVFKEKPEYRMTEYACNYNVTKYEGPAPLAKSTEQWAWSRRSLVRAQAGSTPCSHFYHQSLFQVG